MLKKTQFQIQFELKRERNRAIFSSASRKKHATAKVEFLPVVQKLVKKIKSQVLRNNGLAHNSGKYWPGITVSGNIMERPWNILSTVQFMQQINGGESCLVRYACATGEDIKEKRDCHFGRGQGYFCRKALIKPSTCLGCMCIPQHPLIPSTHDNLKWNDHVSFPHT